MSRSHHLLRDLSSASCIGAAAAIAAALGLHSPTFAGPLALAGAMVGAACSPAFAAATIDFKRTLALLIVGAGTILPTGLAAALTHNGLPTLIVSIYGYAFACLACSLASIHSSEHREPCCPHCAYPRAGLEGTLCPECGTSDLERNPHHA